MTVLWEPVNCKVDRHLSHHHKKGIGVLLQGYSHIGKGEAKSYEKKIAYASTVYGFD